jgi:hypothetical protein
MYFDDHNPPHAIIMNLKLKSVLLILVYYKSDLPPKALSLVLEWTRLHQEDLLKDWELAVGKKPLFNIEPLK